METTRETAPNMTDHQIRRRRFLRQMLVTAGLVGTGFAGLDTNALTLEQRKISIPGWPRSAAGFKLGQLSDFHCDRDAALGRVHDSVMMLLEQKPDAIVLTGDYVSWLPETWAAVCADLLSPLASVPGGVYCVLGNHDQWAGNPDLVIYELRRVGFTVLENESIALLPVPGVWLTGLRDVCAQLQDVPLALRGVPQDALKLLLVHEPDIADGIPPGFSLQLSGHSHGGQIRVPGFPVLYAPYNGQEYPEGLQQARHHRVYTTRGVGLVGPQFRYCCPPEVTLLHLHPA